MTHKYAEKLSVAVVGARGYSGLELLRILMKHPGVRVDSCFATDAGFSLSDYLPETSAQAIDVQEMSRFKEIAAQVKTVFLATPAEVSAELAPVALTQGADVIDLSGAFRLESAEAKQWYGLEFLPGATPEHATYGLVPWVGPPASTGMSRLVANPGCFATSVLMAIVPLLREKLVDPSSLVIDSKSGTTGAGRKLADMYLYSEVEGECLPYRVGKHQHLPEIRRFAEVFGGLAIDPMFSTSLLPVRRGIISGIYAKTIDGVTLEQIQAAFAKAYSGYKLVRFGPIQGAPRQMLSLKRITGSARTEIRFELVGNKLYLFSLIDNLLKGAASQAVENFNRLHDFPLTTALQELEGVL